MLSYTSTVVLIDGCVFDGTGSVYTTHTIMTTSTVVSKR